MLPYWILFGMFALGAVDHRRRGAVGDANPPLLIVAMLVVGLMIGLRYEVGGDWEPYQEIFALARYLRFDEVWRSGDPGYALLNWVTHQAGLDIWFVNLICGLIFARGLHKFARRQPNPWLAVLVSVPYLIIVVAMGYSRQAVAIGFLLGGLAALDRRGLGGITVYIVLAAAFHKTAIILLPLVALAAVRHRIAIIGLMFVLGLLLYYMFLDQALALLYVNYLEAEYNSQGAAIRVALNVVPAAIFLLFRKQFALSQEQHKLWRNFSFAALGTLIILFISPSSTVVDRLGLYLIPLQIFVLSRLPEAFSERGRPNGQVILLLIIYSAVIQGTWLMAADNAKYWLPYRVFPLFGR